MEQMIKNIPLTDIQVSPLNPRKTFDQSAIEELAENIKRQGLLQPITVRPVAWCDELVDGEVVSIPARYEIVCGERRYRAVTQNGSETIPCIVREMTDDEAFDAMITENLQRKDVDPIEEAFAFGQLYARGNSVEDIAQRFGKSVRFIRERIKLDELMPELKEWVTKGWIHLGAALHIAKLSEEDQGRFMEQFERPEDEDEDDEPITLGDAVSFTDNLFKRIITADWDEEFTGPCGVECAKCQFNNANEGCLFNEMKVTKDNACCTNGSLWTAKRLGWYKGMIDGHADHLVKQGEELRPGKMVVAYNGNYWNGAESYQALKDYVTEQGYMMVNVEDVFERWQRLNRDEESTRAKLVEGEAYIVLLIDSDYRGVKVTECCYPLRQAESKDNAVAAKVGQLVRDHKSNIDRSKSLVAMELRNAVRDYNLNAISWKAMTNVEWEILLIMIINSAPYDVRDAIMGTTKNEADFVKEHNTAEGRDDILRKWMRGKLSDSGVQYYPTLQECQRKLVEVWGIDDVQVQAKAAERLRKKQEKIEKELTALGYDTEGNKLAF